jgi:hypothetical protein
MKISVVVHMINGEIKVFNNMDKSAYKFGIMLSKDNSIEFIDLITITENEICKMERKKKENS